MKTPICQVCGCSDAAMFYKSIATHCMTHWKERVRLKRAENIEHYREFDRRRANNPDRVQARKAYAQTEAGKAAHQRAHEKYTSNHPKRRSAQVAVGNAVRDGRIKPLPCFMCGESAEAHHPDYDRPLDVVWLCSAHHKQAHAMTTRLMNHEQTL